MNGLVAFGSMASQNRRDRATARGMRRGQRTESVGKLATHRNNADTRLTIGVNSSRFAGGTGATLAADFARAQFGAGLDAFFRYVPAGAYVGAAAMWLLAFCREETIAPRKAADLEAIEKELDYVTEQTEKARKKLGLWSSRVRYTP